MDCTRTRAKRATLWRCLRGRYANGGSPPAWPARIKYYAVAGADLAHSRHGRPYLQDSQLGGAFIVDPPGAVGADRVFVLGLYRTRANLVLAQQVGVINGKSWPYTERLAYPPDQAVHWRWINASDSPHPMHMHGSYFRVEHAGDGESDRALPAAEQPMLATYDLEPGATMATVWSPPSGHWVFHCHFLVHITQAATVANALAGRNDAESHPNHMAGMVLGIVVAGDRPAIVAHGLPRQFRLLVRERPARDGGAAGFGYQVEEGRRLVPEAVTVPGPPLILERGRPVEITVANQLHEPTSVHWHGIELESYYDGVVDWGARGSEITPAVAPGDSFRARFTPPRAGTFIYHAHLNDEEQLGNGLYGALIVLEPGARFDSTTDHIFVASRDGPDTREVQTLVNGTAALPTALHWRVGRRYRLRLIDIAPSNGVTVSLTGPPGLLQWRTVAKDGADLPTPQATMRNARQRLLPGETYDFECQSHGPGALRLEFAFAAQTIVQQIEVR